MATVILRQATNMGGLPTQLIEGASAYANGTSFGSIMDSGDAVHALGTFTLGSFHIAGTISEVIFDTNDFDSFPNIDITGLSFSFTEEYFGATEFNYSKLLSDMLAGNDQLTGSSGNDTIMGFAGNDTMVGGGGDNLFNGGDGFDTVSYASAPAGLLAGLEDWGANTGEAAGDSYSLVENLIGSSFNDILYGTDANNRFTGGAGNDQMVGKGGADRFDGGTGTDTVYYDASFPYSGNLAIRADLLAPLTNTGDAIGDAYISIENLEGSSFDDILLGTNSANVIRGNHFPGLSGNDQLFGRSGNDTLIGNDGDDRLIGGLGRDVMLGGNGADRFDFNAASETGTGAATRDQIAGFAHLTDKIDLSTIDANGAAAGDTAFSFLATQGAAFTGVHGQLRWFRSDQAGSDNDSTFIAGDINGDRVPDFQIELTGLKTLTAADFFL